MVIWVAAILLVTAVALFIAAPLSDRAFAGHGSATNSAINMESERRERERALAVQALRELEFDQEMGKLDAGDYSSLREKLENRALAAMGGQGKTLRQSPPDQVAQATARLQPNAPARTVTVNFCSQCGTRISWAHNFCANCGAALAVTSAAIK
ncbi:MAG: hypothetical protein JO071_13425 [Deltaproteobacteria bacterium]|nr:hypothetical protein [Deltaproteobacteria bacterium]